MNSPNYCPLPITDRRRAYVSSHNTTPEYLAEVFRRHQPILVSAIDNFYMTEAAKTAADLEN
jgi:hypothetical protein